MFKMNSVEILYVDNINALEIKIKDFAIDHNVISVSVYSRSHNRPDYAAIIVYKD